MAALLYGINNCFLGNSDIEGVGTKKNKVNVFRHKGIRRHRLGPYLVQSCRAKHLMFDD